MKISDILSIEKIQLPLIAKEKESVLKELWELIKDSPDVKDADKVQKSIMEREKRETTGIGQGIAIPHGKCSAVTNIIAVLGLSSEGVDFDSLDGKPVHIVFLLVAPEEKAGLYLKSLSRISRLLNNEIFRRKLIEVKDRKKALEMLKDEEKKYFEI